MLLSMTKTIFRATCSFSQKTFARAPPSSTSENPFGHSLINSTGCIVVLHNLGTKNAITRVCIDGEWSCDASGI